MIVELYGVCPHLQTGCGESLRLRQDMHWNIYWTAGHIELPVSGVPNVSQAVVCDSCAEELRDGRPLPEGISAVVGPLALRRSWWRRLVDRISRRREL